MAQPLRLVRRSEPERIVYTLGIVLERLAELRRLVLPQVHGRSPHQYAERGFASVEALLASLRGSLTAAANAPTSDIEECDCCGLDRAIVRTESNGVLCGKCAEVELAPQPKSEWSRADEQIADQMQAMAEAWDRAGLLDADE